MSDLTPALVERFGALDKSLLTESLSLCTHYRLTPDELFYKWEAFAINNLAKGETYTLENARELRKLISSQTSAAAQSTSLKPSAFGNRTPALGGILGLKTPAPVRSAFQIPTNGATPASASAYRTQALDQDIVMDADSPRRPVSTATFQTLETLNSEQRLTGSGAQMAKASSSSKKAPTRVTLAVATDPKAWNYRYMFEKKGERSQVLDDRIDQFASMMREAYHFDAETELGDPSMPSQEPIYVVGRICPNLPPPAMRAKAKEGEDGELAPDHPSGLPKMAETGVVLEASRMMGSGNRVPIFLTKGCRVRYGPEGLGTAGSATTVGLFPGMIVMLKGMNGGGERFGVEEILMPPPLPHAESPAEELEHAATKLEGKAINLLTASGPFTDDSDLEFAPWHRLMDELEQGGLPEEGEVQRRGIPDVLVLMGPFLSTEHPELPFATWMPSEIVKAHVTARLARLMERYPGMLVVLLPSTNDIINVHSAFPQPGFSKEDDSLASLPRQRLKCLPNPSVFYINELVVAASTADVLKDLKTEELVLRIDGLPGAASQSTMTTKDAMSRLARHVLAQRSFYPLFPAPVPLDISHSHLLAFPAVSPDLLILPSSLRHFVRVVESTVVVNPGRLAATSRSPGTLASLHVVPSASTPSGEMISHKAYERSRIDIVQL